MADTSLQFANALADIMEMADPVARRAATITLFNSSSTTVLALALQANTLVNTVRGRMLFGPQATMAAAPTLDLDSLGSHLVEITGAGVNITAVAGGSVENPIYFGRFAGAVTLVHHATNMILPNGGANIVTAAGDTFIGERTANGFRVRAYYRANGQVVGAVGTDGAQSMTGPLNINATGASPVLNLQIAGATKGIIGAVQAAGSLITGSVVDDIAVRTQGGRLLVSTNSGSTAAVTVAANGNVNVRAGPGLGLTVGKIQILDDSPFITGANISVPSGPMAIGTSGSSAISFFTGNTNRWSIDSVGTLFPVGNGTYDFGASANVVRDVYASSLSAGAKATRTILDFSSSTLRVGAGSNWQQMSLFTNGAAKINVDLTGNLYPSGDGTQACGWASTRWSVVYAASGTINTSDMNFKWAVAGSSVGAVQCCDATQANDNEPQAINDAILDAIGEIQAFIYWDRAAYAEKGPDLARFHAGFSAQDVQVRFAARGLDVTRFGFWCSDPEVETFTNYRPSTRPKVVNGEPVMASVPVLDENGEPVTRRVAAMVVDPSGAVETVIAFVDGEPVASTVPKMIPVTRSVQLRDQVTGELLTRRVQRMVDVATPAPVFQDGRWVVVDQMVPTPQFHPAPEPQPLFGADGQPVTEPVENPETGEVTQVPVMVQAPAEPIIDEVPWLVDVPVYEDEPVTQMAPVMEPFDEPFEDTRPIPGSSRLGIRYSEIIVLILAWQRRELARMAARLDAVESVLPNGA